VWGDSESQQPGWSYDEQYLFLFMQWVYKRQFEGIQNLTFGLSGWIPPMNERALNWLYNFPSLRELIVVLGPRSEIPEDRTPTQFTPVKPDTARAETAKMVMWRLGKCLNAFQVQFPNRSISWLRVVSHFCSYEGDSSASADAPSKRWVQQQMRKSAEPFRGVCAG
jgi:hypothetical protein